MRLHPGCIGVVFLLLANPGCGNTRGALGETDAGELAITDAGDLDQAQDAEEAQEEASSPVETCMTQAPPDTCPEPAPTYADIAPIIERRCAMCHGKPGGAWPLNTYQNVADWYDSVQSHLVDCTMPPADAGVPMGAEERHTILAWIRCGRLR